MATSQNLSVYLTEGREEVNSKLKLNFYKRKGFLGEGGGIAEAF